MTFICSTCGHEITLTLLPGEMEKGFMMTCFNVAPPHGSHRMKV